MFIVLSSATAPFFFKKNVEQNIEASIVSADYLLSAIQDEPVYSVFLAQQDLSLDQQIRQYYNDPLTKKDVIRFFSEQTGSSEIAEIILYYADVNDISFFTAFSLSWAESRFNPLAINQNSSSTDRGLFQLNSRSFPDLTEAQFFDPRISASKGLEYLALCQRLSNNEVVALAMYNAGPGRVSSSGAPEMTLRYISHIERKKGELSAAFFEEFNSFLMTNSLGEERKTTKSVKMVLDSIKAIN